MKYTSMSNAIHTIINPTIKPVVEPIVEESPVVVSDVSVADTTIEYPPNEHHRLTIADLNDRDRMKMHLKLSMRRQHQSKIIDNA